MAGMRGSGPGGPFALVAQAAVLLALALMRGEGRRGLLRVLAVLEGAVWEIVARRADRMDPLAACCLSDARGVRRGCGVRARCREGSGSLRRRVARIRAAFAALDICAARLAEYRRRALALAGLPPGAGEVFLDAVDEAHLVMLAVPVAPDTS